MELQEDEMRCPYCDEIIRKAAKVCKHCHRSLMNPDDLNSVASSEQVTNLSGRGERLKKAVAEYMTAGWLVSGSTDSAVQMVQPKKFDTAIFIVLCVVGAFTAFIPPLIYWVWWIVKKPPIVTLTVDENLDLLVNGVKSFGPPASAPTLMESLGAKAPSAGRPTSKPAPVQTPVREQTPEEKEAAAASTRKALLIIGAVIAGFIILSCICSFFSALGSNNNVPAAFLPVLTLLI